MNTFTLYDGRALAIIRHTRLFINLAPKSTGTGVGSTAQSFATLQPCSSRLGFRSNTRFAYKSMIMSLFISVIKVEKPPLNE